MSTTQDEAEPTPSPAPTSPTRAPSLWRNRDYMILWSGQAVSILGTSISQLAFPLLILAITHSPAQAGLASALNAFPFLLLSLPVGALIDRWNRKRVMILCDTIRALNMATIPLALVLGHVTLLQIYCNCLIEGTCFVFFDIAEAASLSNVVANEEHIAAAVGQNQATRGTSTLIGPLISGVLFIVYRFLPFLLDAISYAVSVTSLLFIRTKFQQEHTRPARNLLTEIAEGLKWLWSQPVVRFMALLTGGINFLYAGVELTVIILAQRLGASAPIIGIIFTIGGIGSIVGSLLAAPLRKRFSFGQVIIGTVWLITILWPLYSLVPNPLLLGVVSAVIFTAAPIYNVMQFSYRLTLIPDELQGRVNSVFRLIAFGFQPLGLAVIGALIQLIGVIQVVRVFTIYLVILALLATFNTSIRHARAGASASRAEASAAPTVAATEQADA